jgi:hypothetical protein
VTVEGSQEHLEAGEHSFPFQMTLREDDVPASVTCNQLCIKYKLTTEVSGDVSLRGGETELLVCGKQDTLIEPENVTAEQDFMSCLVINKGKVRLSARASKAAFAPGEECSILLTIDARHCKVDITAVSLKLQSTMTMIMGMLQKQHTVTGCLAEASQSCLVLEGTAIKKVVKIGIPAECEPCQLHSEPHFKLEHAVVVTVSAPMCSDVTVTVPVFINKKEK